MNNLTKGLFTLILFFIVAGLHAQSGQISGTVKDSETESTLPGVNVVVEGTTKGTVTDLDGQFSLNLDPGQYTIRFSFISFEPQLVSQVVVDANQTTQLSEVHLQSDSKSLQEVVVTASMVRNNETAMLSMKKKSANMIDAISSASFSKSGDSDAAASIKRVPGVSIQSGKYIYVRGLSDRYTKTLLNGYEVPGLDPDRNTLQMDIFPTNVLENIVVNKTFMASLPADFTGGAITISMKDFPEEERGNVSLSLGYNPSFHFNPNYLTYTGSKTDFLGFDNGHRDIPAIENIPQFAQVVGNPNGENAGRYKQILGQFTPEMGAFKSRNLMDFGIGFDYGNQKVGKKLTTGYQFIVNYKNESSFYEEVEYSRYGLSANRETREMEIREQQKGSYGTSNITLSAMAGFAVKTSKSKLRLNLLRLQNGESKAGIFDYANSDKGAEFSGYQHNLEYGARSMTNLLIAGEHYFSGSRWGLSWGVSPTYSTMDDPDVRFTRYELRNNEFVLGTEAGFPQRIWRDLSEVNIPAKIDVEKEFKLFSGDARIQFGGSYTHKQRDYNIRSFNLNVRGLDLTGNPDELFFAENLWPIGDDPTRGTTFDAVFLPNNPNEFNASANNTAGYASLDFHIARRLKTSIGLRLEHFVQRYSGQDQLGTRVLNNEEVLNATQLFPSLNTSLQLSENQNLRFSYTQTVARPSLKELSYAEIHDPLTGRTFIGGMFRDANDVAGIEYWNGELKHTDIHNLDLRWETFPTLSSIISFGVFYKYFINPIEMVQFATQVGAFQPRNVGNGQVYGAEVEWRSSLAFLTQQLRNFTINANLTITESRIALSETERASRADNARTGQKLLQHRAMAGQAPLILNTGISYNGGENGFAKGLQVGAFYNVQSATLIYVGIVDRPDIYSKAFHSLNLKASKTFGTADRFQVSVKASNVLGSVREEVFKSYKANDQTFTRLNPGRTFSLGLSYRF